jgi:hypothetical protein
MHNMRAHTYLALGVGVVCLFVLLQVLHRGAVISPNQRQIGLQQDKQRLCVIDARARSGQSQVITRSMEEKMKGGREHPYEEVGLVGLCGNLFGLRDVLDCLGEIVFLPCQLGQLQQEV